LGDVVETTMRSAHLLASAAWMGGSIFYVFVLSRAARTADARAPLAGVAQAFARVVSLSAWTLLATGGYLTFDRLSNTRLETPYVVVLALKILLALWMMLLAGALSRNRGRRPLNREDDGWAARWRVVMPAPRLILVLGTVIFVLSAVLTTMYQAASPPGVGG